MFPFCSLPLQRVKSAFWFPQKSMLETVEVCRSEQAALLSHRRHALWDALSIVFRVHVRFCQTNSNPFPHLENEQVSGSDEVAPFEKSCATKRFEPGPALDIPLMTEVVVYR
jgi:hypothetical protein